MTHFSHLHHSSQVSSKIITPKHLSIDMASDSMNNEKIFERIKDYDQGRSYSPINNDGINPYNNPEKLLPCHFHSDGKAYFYAKYVDEPKRSSEGRWTWIRGGCVDIIRDVGQIIGYKETFDVAKDGNLTGAMTKYFLHQKDSNRNKSVIYVVTRNR